MELLPLFRVWVIATLLVSVAGQVRKSTSASGCPNFVSDDLTNRVTKKSTLSFLQKLIDRSKFVSQTGGNSACPELTFKGFNINLDPLESLGRLATRNGHVIHDLLNSKSSTFLNNVTGWPAPPSGEEFSQSIVNPTRGCKTEANPFSGGNPIFGSLTHATLVSSDNLFAAGGCLGTGPVGKTDGECFYRHKVYSKNTTSLVYVGFPPAEYQWWYLPKRIVKEINETRANLSAAPVPVSARKIVLDGRTVTRLDISYSTRLWTDPYFDCELGKIWMITYSAPITYVADDGQIHSAGMTGVDINLSDIDLNECDTGNSSSAFDAFKNTHLCEPVSTTCRSVTGRGFNFGSYRCFCRPGYYRRDSQGRTLPADSQFFEGSDIDNSSAVLRNTSSCGCADTASCVSDAAQIRSILERDFSCQPCPEGCDTCVTGLEVCTHTNNKGMIIGLSVVNIIVLIICFAMVICVFYYRQTRVIRSASWPFLITTLLGAVLAIISIKLDAISGGLTSLKFSDTSCALAPWFHFTGFALTYGSILVKTWRLHQIFSTRRFRGKGRRSLSNGDLGVILLCIVLGFAVLLLFWTIGLRSTVQTLQDASGLKYKSCSVSFINNIMEGLTIAFLLPVVYLSYQLRNITDDFSETKEIHITVYIFIVVKIISLAARQIFDFTPDLFYLLNFLDIHLSFSLLIAIFFASKINKLATGKEDSKPASSFILNKKRGRPGTSECNTISMSLDDAHRRMSSVSLDVGSNSSPRDSAGSTVSGTTGVDICPAAEQVAYLPSLSEEKNATPPLI